MSCAFLNEKRYGVPCSNIKKKTFNQLLTYKESLIHHRDAFYYGYDPCLCPKDFQLIVESTKDIVDMHECKSPGRKDLIVDRSNFDSWVISNPTCVAYEDWERCLYRTAIEVEISVEKIKPLCPITFITSIVYKGESFDFDEKGNVVNNDKLDPALQLLFTIQAFQKSKHACDVNFTSEFVPINCDLDLDTYVSLVRCGLTADMIATIQDCGIDVEYDLENNCPILSFEGIATSLCDFDMTPEAIENICTIISEINTEETQK